MRDVRQRSFFALDQNTRFSSVFLLRHELDTRYERTCKLALTGRRSCCSDA